MRRSLAYRYLRSHVIIKRGAGLHAHAGVGVAPLGQDLTWFALFPASQGNKSLQDATVATGSYGGDPSVLCGGEPNTE